MCNNPITQINRDTGEEITFACRKCTECLASRINDWVARGVAEKAMSGETLVIRLSYRNNPDGSKPVGAMAFNYADVQVFLKRLRETYFEEYQARGEIRYLSCGERGEKFDRVHYHIVLFSKYPMSELGKWVNAYDEKDKGYRTDKDLIWSMWDHGHVRCQVPDQGGIYYALKYAFADQFNSVKSKGTRRFTQSTDNSASHFRQSRKPPVGFTWLEQKINSWEDRLIVPSDLNLKPPEYKGFWYPSGKMREYLIHRLYEINQKCRQQLGRDAAAWDALLASVMSQEKEWEYLQYGEVKEEEEPLRNRYEWTDGKGWQTIKEKCGGWAVCSNCFKGLDPKQHKAFRSWRAEQVQEFVTGPTGQYKTVDEYFRSQNRVNPFCYNKGQDWTRDGTFA